VAVKGNALGDYLRARREHVRPEDVGLIPGARRRVAGLRREELAVLAGISSEYYLRLEQGRDKNPSPQILDALARALQLDIKGTEYLYQLASGGHVEPPDLEAAADGLDELIEQFAMPAILANRYQDVLAANAIARALSPGFAPGQNFLRWRLVEPAAKEFFVDWDEAIDIAVSGLREVAGSASDDPRMRQLVGELSAVSARFRELWARADVGYRAGITHLRHPVVGDLYLRRYRLSVPHAGGQHLIIFGADPGSPSAKALETLRSQRQ
jgi:transcriptional regulator with XRE-family HTH domain